MSLRKHFNFDFFLNLNLIFKVSNIIPDYEINNILELNSVLNSSGIKGLVFDIDQTIIPFGRTEISKEFCRLLKDLSENYTCCLLSNFVPIKRRIERVRNIEEQIGIKVVEADKKKPSPDAFKQALDFINLPPEKTAMIGDRLFTDIIGANNVGMKTIMVKPLNKKTDPIFIVTIPRFFEFIYLKIIKLFNR